MEDDEETPLLSDRDRESWRRPWQHGNAFIRLPSQSIRHVWRNPQLMVPGHDSAVWEFAEAGYRGPFLELDGCDMFYEHNMSGDLLKVSSGRG